MCVAEVMKPKHVSQEKTQIDITEMVEPFCADLADIDGSP
jgi:hypothetical protein